MDRQAAVAALAPALLLYACDRAANPAEEATPSTAPNAAATESAAPAATPSAPPPGYTDGEGVNEGYPDLTPPKLSPEAEKGIEGARNVTLSFARAIELKEFDQAWALLSPGDKQRWPRAEFTRMFADLGTITVAIPDGTSEGACGSVYYTAPVTITATDKNGRPVRYEGEAVLRRVNDVDGATPAQLRWHFDHLTLDWTH